VLDVILAYEVEMFPSFKSLSWTLSILSISFVRIVKLLID